MRTLTLKQVLAGAARAHDRVSKWPAWKRDLGLTGDAGQGRSNGMSNRIYSLTIEDARKLIGREIRILDDSGEEVDRGEVRKVANTDVSICLTLLGTGWYIGCGDDYSFEALKDRETPAERVARLETQAAEIAAELVEAKAAAAHPERPELPSGFKWSSDEHGP